MAASEPRKVYRQTIGVPCSFSTISIQNILYMFAEVDEDEMMRICPQLQISPYTNYNNSNLITINVIQLRMPLVSELTQILANNVMIVIGKLVLKFIYVDAVALDEELIETTSEWLVCFECSFYVNY